MMEEFWIKGAERVAVRVELEATPLKGAPIPPCRIHSIAICSGVDGSFVLYVGTDSGHVLRYALSSPASAESFPNSPIQSSSQNLSKQQLPPLPPLILPPSPTPVKSSPSAASSLENVYPKPSGDQSPPSVHRSSLGNDTSSSPSSSFSTLSKRHGRSQNGTFSAQSSGLGQSRNTAVNASLNRPSSAPGSSSSPPLSGLQSPSPPQSVEHADNQTLGARRLSSPSSPQSGGMPLMSSPFSFSSPQISSLSADHENGSTFNSPSAHPSSPALSASAVLDSRAVYKPSLEMTLTMCRQISKSPVESLCALPECGWIAILSEGQIALLGLGSLNIVDRLGGTKGAVTVARGVSSSILSLQDSFYSSSQQSRTLAVRNELTMKGLFDRGKMSSRFGGLVGGLGEALGAGKLDRSSKSGRLGASEVQANSLTGSSRAFQSCGRLAVALKKKILLFEVRPLEQDRRELVGRENDLKTSAAVKVRELAGIEGVVAMAWLGDVIIVGTMQEYLLLSLVTGSSSPLFSLPQEVAWRPLLKVFPKDRQALLLIDNAGIPINAEGHPAGGSLQFQMIPDGIGFSSPYVVIVKQGVVELYHHKTGSRMQSLHLHDAGRGKSLVADDDDGQFIVVANSFKVWCLRQVPLEEQLKELLKNKSFSEAIRLAEDSQVEGAEERTKYLLSMVHAEIGFLHLFDLHFKEAIDHFLRSDIVGPAELFPFFPSMTSRWRTMVPRKRYWGLHPPPQPMTMVIESGLLAIKSGLLAQTQLLGVNSESEDISLGSKSGKDAERYLILAMQHVARYLDFVRETDLKSYEKEGVDTFLMKLYTELHATTELEELAASTNSCVLDDVENLLKAAGQLRALALLYESKRLWSSALQVWQTLAHAPDSSAGGLRNLSSQQLSAASEAARLLEESSDSPLVLEHLSWIIKLDENLALTVLTSSKREDPLPADNLMDQMAALILSRGEEVTVSISFPTSSGIFVPRSRVLLLTSSKLCWGCGRTMMSRTLLLPTKEDALVLLKSHGGIVHQRYLLWLVKDQGREDPQYHTELAISLAKSALDTVEQKDGNQSKAFSSARDHAPRSSERPEALLDASAPSSSMHMGMDSRDELLDFLESSEVYDAKIVLDCIRNSELWKEQFVLHRRLGDELSALRTLALKLEDSEAAEKYCAEIGRPEVYTELMHMYLNPGGGKAAMHRAAVRLLHCPGANLDPMQLLEALSPDMPLSLASETVSQMLVSRVHRHRQGQIVRQMNRKENLDARIAKVDEKSRHVCITVDTVCGCCGSRIGTKLFALYPNDMIFCYKCLRQYGERMHPSFPR